VVACADYDALKLSFLYYIDDAGLCFALTPLVAHQEWHFAGENLAAAIPGAAASVSDK